MKFIKALFITFFVIIFIVLVGGFFFLRNIDLNKYSPMIAKKVEDKINRQLSIGNVSVKMSLIPTIIVEDVRLSNADWASDANMIEAQKIELQVAVMPLLKKEIMVKNFILDNTKINLQTNKDGKGNWVFEVPKEALNTSFKFEIISSAYASTPQKKLDIPNIGLDNIEVNKGQITFNNHNIDVNYFDLTMASKSSAINANFDISYNGQKFEGSSVLGSIDSLLSEKEEYLLDLQVVSHGVSADFNGGVLNALKTNPAIKGKLNVYNPASNMKLPEIALSADVEASAKAGIININSLNVAENLIKGRIHAKLEEKPYIDVFLESDLINVETLKASEPLAIKMPSIIATANATEIVPATPINYDVLNVVDAKASVNIGSVIVNKDIELGEVGFVANLNNGVLLLKPFEVEIKEAKIYATASVDAKSQTINANIKSENLKLQNIDKEFMVLNEKDFGILSGGNIDIIADVKASGGNAKVLVESLNGRIIAIANKSVIQTGNSVFLNGFFGTILNAIKLGNVKENKELDLTCAVVRTDIKNGVFSFPKSIALQSNELSLVADGYVNMGNDKLEIELHPYSGDITNPSIASALGGLLKITGTINHPTIGIDEKQALKTVVGLLTTGGASYVGEQVFDMGSSPCYTALENTGLEKMFKAPSKTNQVINKSEEKVVDTTKETAKILEDKAKELLGKLF